jgi:hypothetical protein
MSNDLTQMTALSKVEWEAVAILRTVGNLAIRGLPTALPGRVQAAVDTANALLDRTRGNLT